MKLVIELDLEKYGLSHLSNKPIHTWPDSDIDKLINAFVAENIAPAILGLPFTPHNVEKLLGMSYCRRCGNCCLPNPLDPTYPGVMVYKEDLRLIAKHSHYSYKYLKKKTVLNIDPTLPHRRYLPLPCMFYHKGNCTIYNIRPLICRTYPISDLTGQEGITINVRCDYGKDIYRNVIKKRNKLQ